MLDSATKRRIDSCRDILVGKVPDPKSQVEQITVALIYKFMDDMDLDSEAMGGVRKFFTGEFDRYRWSKLVAPGVSGQDMLNTYSEALGKMASAGNSKLVLMPIEASSLIGSLGGIGAIAREVFQEGGQPPARAASRPPVVRPDGS